MARGERTHLARAAIDFELACRQHEAYERLLGDLGCTVQRLPADPEQPDSVFVEDTCVVLDELAVIARSGAEMRRAETRGVAEVLRSCRRLQAVSPPGTLDGGDVLRVGREIFVGLSTRTNQAAVEQLRRVLEPWGYSVSGVAVRDCLHLKSAVTAVARNTLLLNRAWVDPAAFGDLRLLEVDPAEPYGANALLLRDRVIFPTSFPRTARRLADAGIRAALVDVSELQKAEGAVTCCSVIYEATASPLTLS